MAAHKYSDVIKQWADDTSLLVQWRETEESEWRTISEDPIFLPGYQYRIKPKEIKILGIVELKPGACRFRPEEHWERPNIELVFDAETQKLKEANILP